MDSQLMNLCYEGDSGINDIRTCYVDEILYISLRDVFVTLTRENKEIDERFPSKHIPSLIKSQVKDLDDDEYIRIPVDVESAAFNGEDEIFITQPGLNRVMGSDKSQAGKNFQRWLYHKVVPSLQKFGVYPPPLSTHVSPKAQLAEVVAQNARAIADTIADQEMIKVEVKNVKNDVSEVKGDVSEVKSRVQELEMGNINSKHIMTVADWCKDKQPLATSEVQFAIVTWCEHISITEGERTIKCPSGERLNTRFHSKVIEEASRRVL
ncbi:BRO-like protein [Photobacterium chitinilyticum]|uniref:BRO-like protein n=2 Tax=Photobacterium chitinilyticum TaxID=2485123 RepID=A0A3S3UHT0_9GAMM|nr:BRO-like protein [Photobacterium chitinilyticum]